MLNRRHVTLVLAVGLFILMFVVDIVHAATMIDLRVPGSAATINGAIVASFTPDDPSGTGLFNPFVTISSSNQVIHGYNTDFRPIQFEENDSASNTMARLLSEVPQFSENGVLYREFQLDINQNKTSEDYLESVDEIEIYESPYSNLCGYPFDGSGGGHSGCTSDNTATQIWDMDAVEDSFVVLDYRNNEGSGKRDMRLLVPDSNFNQDPNCDYSGAGCTVYVTIYSRFGGDQTCSRQDISTCPNNDGPEQWGVRVPETTVISLQTITAERGRDWMGFTLAAIGVLAIGTLAFLALHRQGKIRF